MPTWSNWATKHEGQGTDLEQVRMKSQVSSLKSQVWSRPPSAATTVKEVKLSPLFDLSSRLLTSTSDLSCDLQFDGVWAIGMHWRRKRDNPTLCYIFTAAHGTFGQRYLLIYLRGHFWSHFCGQHLSCCKNTHFFRWQYATRRRQSRLPSPSISKISSPQVSNSSLQVQVQVVKSGASFRAGSRSVGVRLE